MLAVRVDGWGEQPAVEQVPDPVPGPGELLVEVSDYLIGASDLSFTKADHYQGTDPSFVFPHTPGFRAAGYVVDPGRARVEPGTRVVINGFMGCGSCRWCRTGHDNHCESRSLMGVSSGHAGGAAQYVAAPARQCHEIPDGLSTVESLLCSDASLLLHAYLRADLRLGESVLIVGAGRVGALAITMARAAGAAPILVVDPSPSARERAEELGATKAAAALSDLDEDLRSLEGGGVDVAVEGVGFEDTIADALAAGRPGARTILLGVLGPTRFAPSYYRDVVNKENQLLSTFGKTNREFGLTLRMMGQGLIPLDPLLPDVVPVTDFQSGWQAALDGASARVAISFGGASA